MEGIFIMSCYYIIGMRLESRRHNAELLQKTLTENGCNIRVRLGLHDTSPEYCAEDGLIILQPCGEKETLEQLVDSLNALEGVTAKLMDLN